MGLWNDKFWNSWCSGTHPESSECVMMKCCLIVAYFSKTWTVRTVSTQKIVDNICIFKQGKSGKSFSGYVFLRKQWGDVHRNYRAGRIILWSDSKLSFSELAHSRASKLVCALTCTPIFKMHLLGFGTCHILLLLVICWQ